MTDKPTTVFIVDDDQDAIDMERLILESAGFAVAVATSSRKALAELEQRRPDCIILDIMMPEVDGMELLRTIRRHEHLQHTKVVMVSGKPFEYDRHRAFELGADGFVVKPFQADWFLASISKVIRDRIALQYWGVRGTLPVSGAEVLRYGGDTSCVTLQFSGGNVFIFDAGTGIKRLSNHLLSTGQSRIDAKILLSHPHWDHINALPFFAPLYQPGNAFEIMGGTHGEVTMEKLVSAQMDGVFFPIKVREFAAHVSYRELKEEAFSVDDIRVETMLLSHPGYCLGYKVSYGGRAICYVTDNELFPRSTSFYNDSYRRRLVAFIQGADVLITDTTYTDDEYRSRIGWGHSPVSEVVEVARLAGVKQLHLFHHDPDQDDAAIDAKLASARELLVQADSAVQCVAPAAGDLFEI
jgi:phosphoribosyl 1,2-cyclic phosphodiesterase